MESHKLRHVMGLVTQAASCDGTCLGYVAIRGWSHTSCVNIHTFAKCNKNAEFTVFTIEIGIRVLSQQFME